MKTKSLVSLALASLMFVACSKKEDAIEATNAPVLLSTGLSVQTRSVNTSSNLQATQFDAGSSIGVFVNEKDLTSASVLTYQADGSGNLALKVGSQPYFPSNGHNVDICGVYPSTSLVSGSLTNTEVFSVKADQTSDVEYKKSDLMTGSALNVARTSNSIPVTFYHRLSKINVKLAAGVDMTDAKLLGAEVRIKNTFTSTEFAPKTGVLGTLQGNVGDIVLESSATADVTSSAIIVPQTLAINTDFIQIKLPAGGIYTYTLPAAKQFLPGNAYSYLITVNSIGIKVSTTIIDWVTGTEIPGTAQ